MNSIELSVRFLKFGVKIIRMTKALDKSASSRIILRQIIQSGSSAGANYQEAIAAQSKADFIHKTQIVLKELRETHYWLQLIEESSLLIGEEIDIKVILNENIELIKIMSKTVITAKSKL